MTLQEKEEYNKLTKESKEDYDYQKRKHPEWNHNQIMARVSFETTITETIGKGGGNVNPKDPKVLVKILEGGKRFLERLGINIGEVMRAINMAINSLKGLISTGIKYIGDTLSGILDWIFD